MHELSIATRIVESVLEAVEAEQAAVVRAVRVRVGAWSSVVPAALTFAWDAATRGTRLDGAALEIDHVPAAAWCDACRAERELPGDVMKLRCPVCGGPTPRLVRGRELDILSLELIDEHESTTHP